jgi:hypothetical protein
MGILLPIVGYFFPRLAILLLALLSTYMSRAYDTFIWPLLGFIFMPFTTLCYAVAVNEGGGVSGVWLALVVFAVLVDIGLIKRGADRRKHRRDSAATDCR